MTFDTDFQKGIKINQKMTVKFPNTEFSGGNNGRESRESHRQ